MTAFNVNDRVKLRPSYGYFAHYEAADICTVMEAKHSRNLYGIVSDSDPDKDFYLWVSPDDIIHVTNVPSRPVGLGQPAAAGKYGAPMPPYVDPQGPAAVIRTFGTGATRDTDEDKLDFEGFLSPLVLEAFASYMHGKRKMPDGSLRDSDNWQKGIPMDAYMKSMWRHFFAVWKGHREGQVAEEELLALLFNVQGYAHEILKGSDFVEHALKNGYA